VFVPKPVSEDADRAIQLRLGPGSFAAVIQIVPFVGLRGTGSDDSFWIAAPDATSREVGEEEQIDVVGSKASLGTAPSSVVEEEKEEEESPASDATVETPEIEQSVVDGKDDVESEGSNAWSDFVRGLSVFFISIWNWILALFQPSSSEVMYEAPAEEKETDEEYEDVLTPDENTPLLDSPETSRATSSTAVSPLPSPSSVTTIKASQSQDLFSIAKIISTDRAEAQELEVETIALGHPVQIRSYAQFTFTASPFKFLLVPAAVKEDVSDRVRLTYRRKGETGWTAVSPDFTQKGGGACHELLVGEGIDGQGEYEVQIERV